MLQIAGDEEFPRIIDFGIATVLETATAAAIMQTRVVGTLAYMAPEQLQGRPTAASDIFALGVIAFEMVTGQQPFNADSETQLIELQRAGAEEKLRELRSGLPEAARAAILKAMGFEASDRYATPREFSEAFNQALAKPDQPDPFQTTPIAPALRQPTTRQRRWLLPTTVLIALLATAAVGTIAWQHLSPASSETPAGARADSPTAAERSLSYSLKVQKNPKRYPGSQPFTSPGDISFEAGDQAQLNLSSPQAGYLYVINEGPARTGGLPDFVVMFPNADGSAQVAANQPIQIPSPSGKPELDWIVFDEEVGMEKVWLIWSERSVPELDAVKSWANPRDKGVIGDPSQIRAVAQYLAAQAATKPEVEKNEASRQTALKGKSAVLVSVVKLEHR
jgi:serine/threonine protein kinase